MFCGNCGTEYQNAPRFCGKCGAAISTEVSAAEILPQQKLNSSQSLNKENMKAVSTVIMGAVGVILFAVARVALKALFRSFGS